MFRALTFSAAFLLLIHAEDATASEIKANAVAQSTSACNLKQWTFKTKSGPAARSGAKMAYDKARGKAVLYGGTNNIAPFGDTWEWSCSSGSWTQKSTTGPSARVQHAMAYDENTGKTVLFGGANASGVLSDTWEWDGTSWTSRGSTPGLTRYAHAMAYDSASREVILFGGNAPAFKGDTWMWDSQAGQWSLVSTTGPSPRQFAGMAADTDRQKVVLFGGNDGSVTPCTYLNDTWEWNGAVWKKTATTGPIGRTSPAMAYDEACCRVALFGGTRRIINQGGFCNSYYSNDTWQWDGVVAAWTLVANGGPTARSGHAMVYDTACGRLVLFGGYDGQPNYTSDTWTASEGDYSTCPTPTGQCCFYPVPACVVVTEAECVQLGGYYQGNGTNCSTPCPPLTGACCIYSGSTVNCVVVGSEGECQQIGGTYQGDFSTCNSPCPPPPCATDGYKCTTVLPGLSVPDNTPAGVTSIMTITETGVIADVILGLEMNHSWVGDLIASLTFQPACGGGTIGPVQFLCRQNRANCSGQGAPFGCGGDLTAASNYKWSDAAGAEMAEPCGTGLIVPSGCFLPDDDNVGNLPLSVFDGLDKAGCWSLNISDNSAGDTGSLISWSFCLLNDAAPIVPPGKLSGLPKATALYQNEPNPLGPATTIVFDVGQPGHARLQIFDVQGRLVRTLVDRQLGMQRYVMNWDGLNAVGQRVAAGVYFYRLEAPDYTATRKMIVLN